MEVFSREANFELSGEKKIQTFKMKSVGQMEKEPDAKKKTPKNVVLEDDGKETESSGDEEKESEKSEKNVHMDNRHEWYTMEEEVQIVKFMYQYTYYTLDQERIVEKFRGPPPQTIKFWQQYLNANESSRNARSLQARYPKLVSKIHKLPLTTEEKAFLFYSLDIPVPEEFMDVFSREVNFALNQEKKIEAFEMKSEAQMKKELDSKKTPKKAARRSRASQIVESVGNQTSVSVAALERDGSIAKRRRATYDDGSMWSFLHEKITKNGSIEKDSVKPTSSLLWKEYLAPNADKNQLRNHCLHYSKMTKNLHSMSFSTRMKVDLYYGLSIPVELEFLNSIQQKAAVTTDEKGCIQEYNSEDFDE